MPKKTQQKRGTPAASRKMTAVEEYEAIAHAEEMLARVITKSAATKQIEAMFSVGHDIALKVVREAEERLLGARPMDMDTDKRRSQHVARLEALYRLSLGAKKFMTCERVLQQLGRVLHVEGPQHIHHTGSSSEQEFEGRSLEELEFYASNGFWPNEDPTQPAALPNGHADDPLKGLH